MPFRLCRSPRWSSRFGGAVVKSTGDGHLVEFRDPTAALNAARLLHQDARTLGLSLRCGVHCGEIERRTVGDIGGLTVHVAARIAALAGPTETLVSRTVADLLGAGASLEDLGPRSLKGVPGEWHLLRVIT